ncbi:MAG: cyclic nucleotide-binding domain-containing protein, partial [Planctomycetes bacterium]|nr:cyclic nucleotide-binding domain-containing protein [Planctomycetota bacterium]
MMCLERPVQIQNGPIDEHLRRQFEAAHARGCARPIDDFLPEEETARYLPTLEELVLVELEFAWKAWSKQQQRELTGIGSQPAQVEDYLDRFPVLTQPEIIARLAEQEYWVRQHYGDQPSVDEYHNRFPQLKTMIDLPKTSSSKSTDVAHNQRLLSEDYNRHVTSLIQIRPFCDLPIAVVSEIANCMVERDFAAGEAIVRQGELADHLVVLLEGSADVTLMDRRQRPHPVCRNVRRAALGEISLLTGGPHCGNVTAVTPVRALILTREDFYRVLRKFPMLSIGFAHLMTDRLGKNRVDVLYDKIAAKYRIKRRLGRGGMAIVYEGQDTRTGDKVALKMMQHPLAYDES